MVAEGVDAMQKPGCGRRRKITENPTDKQASIKLGHQHLQHRSIDQKTNRTHHAEAKQFARQFHLARSPRL
jgi:hypothetical protein